MNQSDMQSRMARLQFMTRRLVLTTLAGDYCSAFKGIGLEFDQLREYQVGDDIRNIDWNSVAKTDKLMVKQFVQERDRTVIIVMDVSASMLFSSQKPEKKVLLEELAASLAWIAHFSKDRIGFVAFSDKIECWISPARGGAHLSRIMKAICTQTFEQKKTDFVKVADFLIRLKKRHAILFMLSDWVGLEKTSERLLRVLRCEYDFVAFRILDSLETKFAVEGYVHMKDIETNEELFVKTESFSKKIESRIIEQDAFFMKNRIDQKTFFAGKPWMHSLVGFFHERMKRIV